MTAIIDAIGRLVAPVSNALGIDDAWVLIAACFALLFIVFLILWIVGMGRRHSLKRRLYDAEDYAQALETMTQLRPISQQQSQPASFQAEVPAQQPAAAAPQPAVAPQATAPTAASVPPAAQPAPEVASVSAAEDDQNLTEVVHNAILASVSGTFQALSGKIPKVDASEEPAESTEDASKRPHTRLSGRIPRV
ncbi:MAG: hypothetical protein LUD25_04015 [Coriobacteriaceae bacterium]|nr:hypothetical protein [Coriobacteriaceae bacterium]